jgi:hypothetical protein
LQELIDARPELPEPVRGAILVMVRAAVPRSRHAPTSRIPFSLKEAPTVKSKPAAPLRIGVVGLVHGHVSGFLRENVQRSDINLVGIAEPDQQLASQYAKRFGLDRSLLFGDVEEMLRKTRPQAVVTYTNTFDHRRVVEICAEHYL